MAKIFSVKRILKTFDASLKDCFLIGVRPFALGSKIGSAAFIGINLYFNSSVEQLDLFQVAMLPFQFIVVAMALWLNMTFPFVLICLPYSAFKAMLQSGYYFPNITVLIHCIRKVIFKLFSLKFTDNKFLAHEPKALKITQKLRNLFSSSRGLISNGFSYQLLPIPPPV